MGVTSIRFNENEEAALNYLKNVLHYDASTLIKKALWEMYEDIKDKEMVNRFEKEEDAGNTSFSAITDLL
ncbi:hypothetical protein LCGC14_2369380 [marine sediment metagenome]|uniref:Uncharacterized protein n=1 Tax=marine sediment metagenome TaxID=412755 RepID=A0A0F9C4C6_9ZZZZ